MPSGVTAASQSGRLHRRPPRAACRRYGCRRGSTGRSARPPASPAQARPAQRANAVHLGRDAGGAGQRRVGVGLDDARIDLEHRSVRGSNGASTVGAKVMSERGVASAPSRVLERAVLPAASVCGAAGGGCVASGAIGSAGSALAAGSTPGAGNGSGRTAYSAWLGPNGNPHINPAEYCKWVESQPRSRALGA